MAKKTFESALGKLEQITTELEAGELGLENSLKKFDEGVKLVEFCSNRLEEARSQVELLQKDKGELSAVPFTNSSTSQDNFLD